MEYLMTSLERKIEKELKSKGIFKPSDLLDIEEIASKYDIFLRYHMRGSVTGIIMGVDCIRIDKRIPYVNQREQFFHELNHALEHVGDQKNMPGSFKDYQEIKARNFALHFAVPTFMLLKLNLPRYRTEAIYKIAQVFQVSHAFAEERLEHFERQVTGFLFYKEVYKSTNSLKTVEQEEKKEIDLLDDLPLQEQPDFKKFIQKLRSKGAAEKDIQSLINHLEESNRKKSVM